jgi:hypothetical protein
MLQECFQCILRNAKSNQVGTAKLLLTILKNRFKLQRELPYTISYLYHIPYLVIPCHTRFQTSYSAPSIWSEVLLRSTNLVLQFLLGIRFFLFYLVSSP